MKVGELETANSVTIALGFFWKKTKEIEKVMVKVGLTILSLSFILGFPQETSFARLKLPQNTGHQSYYVPTFEGSLFSTAPQVKDLPLIYQNYISQWIARRGEVARLTDYKLKLIWQEAEKINLDPFYFLAILAQEGTGSFNTRNSPNGGKPHDNFTLDLKRAANLIKREVEDWEKDGRKGDWLRWVNLGNAGEEFCGGYSEDKNWWIKVAKINNRISGEFIGK